MLREGETNSNQVEARGQADAFNLPEDDDGDLLEEIKRNLSQGRAHRSQWRITARENFDFYAGIQWSEEDGRILKDQRRPAVVFNRTVRTINAVSGLEVQNRQQVKYLARNVTQNNANPAQQNPISQAVDQQGQNSQDMAELQGMLPQSQTNDLGYADNLNNAAKWVRDQNGAEDEETEAFEDMLICGEGWTETAMSYDEDVEGMIIKNHLDPLRMLIDRDSRKRNYEDAKWVAYVKDYDAKEVARMYPDIVNPEAGAFWDDSDEMMTIDSDENFKYLHDKSDQLMKAGKVAVVEYQYYRKEPVYLVVTPDGNQTIELDSAKYKVVKKMLERNGIKSVKVNKKVFYRCFYVGGQVVDKMKLGCDHFTLRSMTGLKDRNRNYWFGLMDMMKDPQRWANKWLSQVQHILNTNAKGGVMIEEDAVADIRDFEEKWAQPDGVIRVNQGALSGGKIQAKDMTKYPDGIDRLLQYAISAISDIPGVNLEMLGMANRDQPIGLEDGRKEAGITVLAKFFDSLRRYRKMDGRILAYYIREYIADGRMMRILGENGYEYVPLLKDKLAFKYDVTVEDSPTSPNVKQQTFQTMKEIFPLAQAAGIPIPPEILDYAPLPDELIQKWKALIKEHDVPDPMVEEMKQIQLLQAKLTAMQQQADLGQIDASTQKSLAEAEKARAVGQEQEMLAAQKAGFLNNDASMKQHAFEQNQQRKDMEFMMTKSLIFFSPAIQYKRIGVIKIRRHSRKLVCLGSIMINKSLVVFLLLPLLGSQFPFLLERFNLSLGFVIFKF